MPTGNVLRTMISQFSKEGNMAPYVKISENNSWQHQTCKNQDAEMTRRAVLKIFSQRQILYINVYLWNLERWYWWTYLQGSDRDTDIENRHVDIGRRGVGMDRESSMKAYTLTYVKQPVGTHTGVCDSLEGWGMAGVGGRLKRKGTHIYTPVADPCWWMTEATTIL